jgi:predicted enzyme related to lactoylglutathione lyase
MTGSTNSPLTALVAVTIDSPDAARLAQFYADLAGGEVTGVYPEYGYAQAELLGQTFNFQTVEGFTAPQWPGQEHPQQFHLDFRVDDVATAAQRVRELGGTIAESQPYPDMWTVALDPDGHPFCLCPPPQE